MSGTHVVGRIVAVLCTAGLAVPASAQAHSSTSSAGGAGLPERPEVTAAACDGDCRQGATLRLTGESLDAVETVVFLGRRGARDDRRVRPASAEAHELTVAVPRAARSGPVRAISSDAGAARSAPRVVVRPGRAPEPEATSAPGEPVEIPGKVFVDGRPAVFRYAVQGQAGSAAKVELYRVGGGEVVQSWPVRIDGSGQGEVVWDTKIDGRPAPVGRYGFRVQGASQATAAQTDGAPAEFDVVDFIFPIRAEHDLGQSDTNNFGGGRGHKGQDMFAACGAPIVAARGGTVTFATYHSRAGNYAVITDDTGQSYAYMHMRKPALVKRGQRVLTGQPIGEVGESGRASGCHLHFELWTAPGWYKGGRAVDPLPELRRWDAGT